MTDNDLKVEISDRLHDEIIDAMCAAQASHGPLTKNLDRVYVILGEEFGELAKEILEFNRINKDSIIRSVNEGLGQRLFELAEKRKRIREEAVQIVATTIHLINGLGN